MKKSIPPRTFNSPLINYANFSDGSSVNLVRLVKPYSTGISFVVFNNKTGDFKTFKSESKALSGFTNMVSGVDGLTLEKIGSTSN